MNEYVIKVDKNNVEFEEDEIDDADFADQERI